MAVPRVPGWQAQILKGVGAPVTAENLRFINAWAQAEGGSAANNPFNTTEAGHGAYSSYNSVGVKNYGSAGGGIQATIDTLNNGRYGAIISALRSGRSAMADAQAEATTPWGTGSLIMKVLGGRVTGGQPTGSVPSGSTPGSSRGTPPNLGYAPLLRPPVDHSQHVVTQKLHILGTSLAAELMAQTSTLSTGGTPDLKNLFTLAKGYQGARKAVGPPPLGGTGLARNAGSQLGAMYANQIRNA